MLKFLTYYAQYYAHVKMICAQNLTVLLEYTHLFHMLSVLLEYIKYGECFIRVLTSMVSVLLEHIDLY